MASVIDINCHKCDGVFKRTLKQTNQVIKRTGVWSCLSCANTIRNKRMAKPIGSIRVHKKSGYIEQKTLKGWRRQHIHFMEMHIGRSILRGEVVHHINGKKTDNRLENLQLMTNGEHTRFHNLNGHI